MKRKTKEMLLRAKKACKQNRALIEEFDKGIPPTVFQWDPNTKFRIKGKEDPGHVLRDGDEIEISCATPNGFQGEQGSNWKIMDLRSA